MNEWTNQLMNGLTIESFLKNSLMRSSRRAVKFLNVSSQFSLCSTERVTCVLRIAKVGSIHSPYLGNMEEQKSWRWPFSFFLNSFIFRFCFGHKVSTDFPEFSKKDNYFMIQKNHVYKNKLKYQNMSYKRCIEKAD